MKCGELDYLGLWEDVPYEEGVIRVKLIEHPGEDDWFEVYRRALKTINKKPTHIPTSEWISGILEARHSPIRYALYSFEFEDIPSNTATHYARHVHAQPYISTLRSDLALHIKDPDHLPRNTPVGMILDVNAEEAQVMANKRLCKKAAKLTRMVMQAMCRLMERVTPEMKGKLVPLCVYCGGVCHEMHPCGDRK